MIDDLNGKFSMAESFWHFHPELEIIQMSDTEVIAVSSEFKVKICCQGGRFKLEDSTWHPEFGLAIPNKKLVLRFSGHKTKVNISWSQK